jgi:glycosyltransferase involved in cell wall biosynthesis
LLIFDAHELPLNDISSTLFTRMKPLLTRLLAGALSYCTGVITVSAPIAQEIHKHYHVPTVSLVRNALAYQQPSKSDRLRQQLELSPEVRIALYQGSWRQNRGLDMLVRAARFLEQDIVIVIMGEGETEAQLEALITSEAVADRVKILPPVPYTELLDWTASADIGLIVYSPDYSLNIRMCLPNKLFEYLMAGLPILTSRLDAVSEVIRSYDVGQIVSSLTPEDIGAAINAMLADPVALARMRRNALEVSQHELCWEKEKSHLIHLYHDILERRNTGCAPEKIPFDGGTHSA